jgi:hypothetical protein
MKRVFILGAGASRELSFNIFNIDFGRKNPVKKIHYKEIGPLSSGYFYYINELQDSLIKDLKVSASVKVPDILMKQIKIYFKQKYKGNINKQELLQEKEISKKVNIEKLFIFLEEKILEKEKNGEKLFRNKSLLNLYLAKSDLIEYIHDSMSYISYYCISINHSILSRYIIENGGNIISFNWDILFEETMINTGKWTPQDGYGISFNNVIYKNEKDKEQGILPKVNSNNLILKPHGSINWYSKDDQINKQILFIQLKSRLRSGNFLLLERQENSYLSSITPPGIKRISFPEVWDKMKKLLEQADEIIAIGFSFNDNDKYIKEEFSGIKFKRDLKIILINPSNEKLKNIYETVFYTDNICTKYKTFSEYCQWIIRTNRV